MLNVNTNVSNNTLIEVDDGLIKIELAYIGEGYNGDFNPEDPDDAKLLRFYSYINTNHGVSGKEPNWEELDDGSCCTAIVYNDKKNESEETAYILEKAIEIHRGFRKVITNYPLDKNVSVKHITEQMSYVC